MMATETYRTTIQISSQDIDVFYNLRDVLDKPVILRKTSMLWIISR